MDSEKIKPKFPRILRYIFTGAAVIVLTVVLLCAAIGYFYEDEIKKVVIKEVNNHLKVPVTVKEIHFSILKSFPYCSVVFNKVAAANTADGKADTLFYFDKLKLK